MELLQDYNVFLTGLGFKVTRNEYDCISGKLAQCTYQNKNKTTVMIFTRASVEEKEIPTKLNVIEEVENELSEEIIDRVYVGGKISTDVDSFNGENLGIVLSSNIKNVSYNPHQLTPNTLKKAIMAQENPTEHMLGILKKHIAHVDRLKENLFPVLGKYDFMEVYNSLIDKTLYKSETSNIYSIFIHPNDFGVYGIKVTTDCLTGDLFVMDFDDVDFYDTPIEVIDKLFVERILTDKGMKRPLLKFDYLFDDDSKHTIDTYGELSHCLEILKAPEWYTMRHMDEINTDVIPEKYMDYYNEAKAAVLKHGKNGKEE